MRALLALPFALLATACGAAPLAAGSAASAPAPAASAACPARTASGPPDHRATSKLRHVPDENDPCADSRGPGRSVH